jgi:hypothetical protein
MSISQLWMCPELTHKISEVLTTLKDRARRDMKLHSFAKAS